MEAVPNESGSSAGRQLKRLGTALALALVAGLLALLVYRLATQESAKGFVDEIAAGKKPQAPGFSLRRLDGSPGEVTLRSLRGKPVVVNFWASWCAPCKREAPVLEAAHAAWSERGVVFVGIDVNDFRSDAESFVSKYGLSYTNLADRAGSTVGHWGVPQLPETFFIDRQGRAVAHVKGQVERDDVEAGIREALQ